MPRDVDPKRTRKALRQVRKLAALQDAATLVAGETPADYSGWEKEFLSEVEARLDKYGSAFADPGKGRPEDALSNLQAQKLKEIERKARGKARQAARLAFIAAAGDVSPPVFTSTATSARVGSTNIVPSPNGTSAPAKASI